MCLNGCGRLVILGQDELSDVEDESSAEEEEPYCDVCLAIANYTDELVCEGCDFLICKKCQLRLRPGGAKGSKMGGEASVVEKKVKRDEG